VGKGMSIGSGAGRRFECSNVSLRTLILFAYDIRKHQLSGGPGWLDDDRYDIDARPSREDAAKEPENLTPESSERLRARVRSLLADRFGLTVHSERLPDSKYEQSSIRVEDQGAGVTDESGPGLVTAV
jgi:uncharacterized protein (TIGR03435 family)